MDGIGIFSGRSDNVIYAAQCPGDTADDKVSAALASTTECSGQRVIVIGPDGPDPDGTWVFHDVLALPSNTTLLLIGAQMSLGQHKDRYVKLITNDNYENGNHDIEVIGIGGARLYDGLFFYNVDTLTLKGFGLGPTTFWAMTLENVRKVQITELRFFQDGLKMNQDGIHIVGPSELITISDIIGTFGDDAIAIDSSIPKIGKGGAVRGVSVTNVVARNMQSCGVIRTVASRGFPVQGLHFSNIYFEGNGNEFDAAIKIGWDGPYGEQVPPRKLPQPLPEEQCDIIIENVTIPQWYGPICVIQTPAKNLTLRSIQATHTGPFFLNLEHEIEGLVLQDIRSTLVGNVPATLLRQFYWDLRDTHDPYEPIFPYQWTILDDPPGNINFDHALIKNATIRDVVMESKATSTDDQYPIAMRIYDTATIDGLFIDNLYISDYATGICIDDGAQVRDFAHAHVRQRGVANPWLGNGNTEDM